MWFSGGRSALGIYKGFKFNAKILEGGGTRLFFNWYLLYFQKP